MASRLREDQARALSDAAGWGGERRSDRSGGGRSSARLHPCGTPRIAYQPRFPLRIVNTHATLRGKKFLGRAAIRDRCALSASRQFGLRPRACAAVETAVTIPPGPEPRRRRELRNSGHPDAFKSLHDFLFSVVSQSRDVIVIADESGTMIFATGAIEAVTGWSASDLVGTDGLHLIHPDDLPSFGEHLTRLFERPDEPSITQARISRTGGGWVWTEVVALNLLADPNVRGLVGHFRDITDRKHAELALPRERGAIPLRSCRAASTSSRSSTATAR